MTERERLIELCKKANKEWLEKEYNGETKKSISTYVADYLLDNGVIVPPCKVGDKVYVIEQCGCYSTNYAEKCHKRQENCNTKKYLRVVALPAISGGKCLKLFERPFKKEWIFKVGKTVFLTREEAEKALKEREK